VCYWTAVIDPIPLSSASWSVGLLFLQRTWMVCAWKVEYFLDYVYPQGLGWLIRLDHEIRMPLNYHEVGLVDR
jgi:hypothetical protein